MKTTRDIYQRPANEAFCQRATNDITPRGRGYTTHDQYVSHKKKCLGVSPGQKIAVMQR